MRIPLNWLRDYVDLVLPLEQLTERLTMSGNEVGEVVRQGGEWQNIFVGHVVALDKHPNADQLKLATIDLGTERLTIVCGAPNVSVGDKVPFARVGARLIDPRSAEPVELKPAKIRGIASEGMACSEKELGISESHEGLMILSPDAPVGTPLADYLGDTILDLELTPNRPDCLSVVGIAWEVAALSGQQVHLPQIAYPEEGTPAHQIASVEISDPDLCPRYCASVVSDVKSGPSPPWMQERLLACGMRPINNVVDITNYVMLEYGQPLHAFDYERLKDGKIIVRRAHPDEVIVSLDGVERSLDAEMLVIADATEPMAVAGVMGGYCSEVTETTSTILLEAANFNSVNLRHTSSRLRMRTEASIRFEKGLSPDLVVTGLRRATQLFVELCGGKAAPGIIDVYPGKENRPSILLRRSRVSQVLGLELSLKRMMEVLRSLGFACEPMSDTELLVTPPYWRSDIRLADDLVEELARVIGYEDIPTTLLRAELPQQMPHPMRSFREQVRDLLVGCSMQEVITYSFSSRTSLDRIDPQRQLRPSVRVANPMSQEQEYLRPTLRAGLLTTLAANEKHQEGGVSLFEVGLVYLPRHGDLPEEEEMICGVLAGSRGERSWLAETGTLDFFDAKGIVETLLGRLGLPPTFHPAEDQALLPGRTATVLVGNEVVGVVGEVHPSLATSFDIATEPVSLFELDMEKLLRLSTGVAHYHPQPRFPGIRCDLALVVAADIQAQQVQDIISKTPLVSQITLFDVYHGEPVPQGKKSIALSLLFQSAERTLTDEEVDRALRGLVRKLQDAVGAILRGGNEVVE
ncbi:phenylalanine--tRNA ligase subunit beta [Chloroflexota bacterium]